MFRRVARAAFLCVSVLVVAGCQGNREMQQEVLNLRNTSRKQLDLLKRQNEFLNRKVDKLSEQVDALSVSTERVSADLAAYAARPEEIKVEIVGEVNTIREGMANAQVEFQTEVNRKLEERAKEVDSRIDTKFTEFANVLQKHTSFVQFVATEQDSINRVFAERFDSRPWYQSIIGKWEDQERQTLSSP
jgi:hypothetical protein